VPGQIWVPHDAKLGIFPDEPAEAAVLRSLHNSNDWKEAAVPLFMDIHDIAGGVAMDDVAKAHLADLQTQTAHDVRYTRKTGGCSAWSRHRRQTPLPMSTDRPTVWSPITSTKSRKGLRD
jgi:hypothetical protein